MENKVLCCILNYNENEKALAWRDRLSPHFDTVVLDSGSNPPCKGDLVLNLDNIFYSGLVNKAYELLLERDYRWLMIVTSDIEIDEANTSRLISGMEEAMAIPSAGLYQPSCRWSRRGRALPQSMCHFTRRIRSVNFQEGWFHLVCREILDAALPVNLEINRMGWGIDLALSHFARIQNRLVMVDDRVRVLHPKGTGYKRDLAKAQMKEWLATIPGYESPRHFKARRMPRL